MCQIQLRLTRERRIRPFSAKIPQGLLTYTADGRMMAIISHDGRKLLSVADRIAAPVEERAQAYSTSMAYAGSYTFTCDKMVHHIEVASLQNWVNTYKHGSNKVRNPAR